MEWIERLNQAINHMEEHITEDIELERLAQIACCSTFHFQRMFSYLAGIPLTEYLRRRRMSLAAADLKNGDEKIIDLALKYGYTSPTAFNRAFQSIHGIPPSQAKETNASVKSYPAIVFKMVVKGAEEMNYRIEQKSEFRIVGVSRPMDSDLETNFTVVPQLWQQVATDGTLPKLASMMDSQPMGILGISVCNDDEAWRYFIAVASSAVPEAPFEAYTVPALTWAIFPGSGACPQAIQTLEQRIVTEWLPTSGFEYANGPDVEVYLNPDPQNSQFEVWIPVVKKS